MRIRAWMIAGAVVAFILGRGSVLLDERAHLAPVDGLRGLAILLVLVWHFSNLVDPAAGPIAHYFVALTRLCWSGVDLFFVLSGFLIGGILIDNKDAGNLWRVFYLRRTLRIFPIYFLMLFGFVLLLDSSLRLPWLHDPMPILSYATFTQNFAMAANHDFGAQYFGVTWSLAIEEQFYLVLPFMVRFLSPRSLLLSVITLIFGAVVFRIGAFYWLGNLASFVLMPGRSDALFIGALCAICYRSPAVMSFVSSRAKSLRWIVFIILCALLAIAYRNSYPFDKAMLFGGITVLAVFYGSILLSTLADLEGPINFIVDRWPLRKLGAIAYGVYLFHQAAMSLMHGILLNQAPRIASMADLIVSLGAYTAAILVAQISWTFLEKPLTKFGHSLSYDIQSESSVPWGVPKATT